jgi:regulator of sigma E protease
MAQYGEKAFTEAFVEYLSWLAAVPVLFLTILLHEVGHFIAARLMKVRVEEFGIGFPPRMLVLGERNGIKYTLNWLPIGGFVKMAGEEDPNVPGSLASKKPWQRVVVLSAGALMNLLLAFLLFTGLAMYGHTEVVSNQLGTHYVEPDSPGASAGLLPGDILVSINNRPITSYEDLQIETTLNRGVTVTLVLDRQGQRITTQLVPRKNPPERQGAIGIRVDYYEAPVTVQWVAPDSPAEQAGLREGDVIVALDGQETPNSLAYMAYADSRLGQELTLTVRRDGQEFTVPVANPAAYEGLPMGLDYHRIAYRTYPLDQALAEGWQETVNATALVPRTLAGIFRSSVSVSDMSGVVGITYAAAQVVRSAGFYGLLRLMAIISVNLFLVNLFPLPALDGGRLVFVLLEWIRGGRRISPEKEGLIHMVGFFLLLALIALITYYDIARVIRMEHQNVVALYDFGRWFSWRIPGGP